MKKNVIKENQARRKVCREMLSNLFSGPNGGLVKDHLYELLEIDGLRGDTTHDTYFNLGKFEALKLITSEANNSE